MSKYDLDNVPWRDEELTTPRRRRVVGLGIAAVALTGLVAFTITRPDVSSQADMPAPVATTTATATVTVRVTQTATPTPAPKKTQAPPPAPEPQPVVGKPSIGSFSCTRSGSSFKAEVGYSTGGSGGSVTISIGPVTNTKSIGASSSWASASASISESAQSCSVTVSTAGGTASRSTTTG